MEGCFEGRLKPRPPILEGLTQGLGCGRVSVEIPCALAKRSASSKAGLASEIWLLRASLAFSKAPSWMGKARCAALIMGSTRASVSTRYESCFWMEKALPMVEWLWKRSAALTSRQIHSNSHVDSNTFPLEDRQRRGAVMPRSASCCQTALHITSKGASAKWLGQAHGYGQCCARLIKQKKQ